VKGWNGAIRQTVIWFFFFLLEGEGRLRKRVCRRFSREHARAIGPVNAWRGRNGTMAMDQVMFRIAEYDGKFALFCLRHILGDIAFWDDTTNFVRQHRTNNPAIMRPRV